MYIRKRDWEKFQAIEDKPRWVHDAIHGTDLVKYNRAAKERAEIEKLLEPTIKLMKRGQEEPVAEFKGPLYRNKKKGKL